MLYNGEEKGDILDQYVAFTEEVDTYYKKYGRTKEGAERLIAHCVERGILAEYLLSRKEEVADMLDVIFDDSIHRSKSPEQLQKEAYEAAVDEGRKYGEITGVARGRQEGAMEKARETAVQLARMGMEDVMIAKALEAELSQVKRWIQAEKVR